MDNNNSSNNNEIVSKAEELLDAAFEGRDDDVVKILATDPSLIEIGDAIGDTAFHVAARAGHGPTVSKMVEFLKNGHRKALEDVLRDVNAQGETPLDLACKSGHNEAAAHLTVSDPTVSRVELAQEAGSEGRREGTVTISVVPSDIEMRLIRTKLSDNDGDEYEDEEEWIRLHKAAAQEGQEDVVVQILEDANDIHLLMYKDEIDRTAFHVAAMNGQLRSLKNMVEFKESSGETKRLMIQGDAHNNTPLHCALEGGYEKTARYLVEVAPRAAFKVNKNKISPLSLAVEKGYPDLVGYMTRIELSQFIRERLLEHAKRISLAHTALRQRNQAVLQALLEGLPELIDVPDRKGWKLLSFAASKGYLDEMCYLLKTFPDCIRKSDEDGSLPIHKAVAGGHVNVVKEFVLRCPQSLHDVDKKDRNIIELATLYQSNDVLAYLNEVQRLRKN